MRRRFLAWQPAAAAAEPDAEGTKAGKFTLGVRYEACQAGREESIRAAHSISIEFD